VAIIDSIINFRRHLKRKNYSQRTARDYMSTLKQFIVWLDCPIEEATNKKILGFIDFLLDKKLQPKTINCYLDSIRSFYEYLKDGEDLEIANPVKRGYCLRLSKPLPRFLKDEEVSRFLHKLEGLRDRAMFLLMLRCGLRVEEVASLTVGALDLRRGKLLVKSGKGAKDRMVYVSPDAHEALTGYLKQRAQSRSKPVFLVDKGRCRGQAISVRGIQKRMEYYAGESGLKVSCHHLRHTMATQLLNADADITIIQDLLGHSRITTTQRYCKVSNRKVQRDYYRAIDLVVKRTSPPQAEPVQGSQ
jgi:site-specific recombinase XerD